MTDPEVEDHPKGHGPRTKRQDVPFDTSDLNNIPRTTDEDPPYQNWWVINEPDDR